MRSWLTQPAAVETLAVIWLLLGLTLIARSLYKSRRYKTPRCPRCEYDLRHRTIDATINCPECGHAPSELSRLYRRRYARMRVVIMAGVSAVFFVAPSVATLHLVYGWQREDQILADIRSRHTRLGLGTTRLCGPDWLWTRLPPDLARYNRRVIILSLTHLQITVGDADLRAASRLSSLEMLSASGAAVDGGALGQLKSLPRLEVLTLQRCTLDDAAMPAIAELQNLRTLNLDSNSITGDGLARLAALSRLEELTLSETAAGGKGLRALAACPRLQRLDLSRTSVTDEDIVALAGLPTLTELRLDSNSQLTDAGVAHLAGLRELRTLSLDGVSISDASVARLADLPHLSMLDLSYAAITENCVNDLARMPALHSLILTHSSITDDGVRRLERQRPNLAIRYY